MEKKKFDISVIICCYKGENTIKDCLNAIHNQNALGINIQVIIVDDGSIDTTSSKIDEFLETYEESDYINFHYYRKENEGLSLARNFGINLSQSDIVAFIDEDAIAESNFCQNLVKHFNKNKKINCIGGRVELLNTENSFAEIVHNSFFTFDIRSESAIIGTNMAFRKDLLIEKGGFQPEFVYRGDESAFLRREKANICLMKVDDVIVKHMQPHSLKRWIKTKYESGLFGMGVYFLSINITDNISKQLIYSFISLILPVLFLLSCIFNFNTYLETSVGLIFTLFLLKKYIINRKTTNYVREYYINGEKNKIEKIIKCIFIFFLSLIGLAAEDFGYIRGYLRFKNHNWIQKSEIKYITKETTK